MALDHPFTGVGPRAFPDHRDAYADLSLLGSSDISFGSSFARVELESPHDLYLLIASEQGLLVALAYAILLAVLLARSLTAAARRRSDGSTALSLVAAGTLALELVILLTADLGGPGSIFIALTMGLAARGAADIDLEGRRPAWSLRPGARRTDAEAAAGGRVAARPDALVPVRLESPV
jgi:O-antigen ligase